MKTQFSFIALMATALCMIIASAHAQAFTPGSVSGTWKWALNVQSGQTINQSARLRQDGERLTGVFTDGFDGASFEIKDGVVRGGQVSFTVARTVNDAGLVLTFNGRVDGDRISGKLDFRLGDEPMTMDWEAARVRAPASKPE